MATAPKLTAVRQPATDDKAKLAELAALIQKIRDDVRTSHAGPAAPEFPLPNLDPLAEARNAAHLQVDAIGRVNPRPAGLLNSALQMGKRAVARGMGWFVRDQVSFNHEVVRSLNAAIIALQETNGALEAIRLAASAETQSWVRRLQADIRRLEDMNVAQQAAGEQRQDLFELTLKSDIQAHRTEVQTQRSAAVLALEHNSRLLEGRMVKTAREFEQSLAATSSEIQTMVWAEQGKLQDLIWTEQKKLWDAFTKTRNEYEALIHSELRLARQRAILPGVMPAVTSAAPNTELALDWLKFAERFRGSEQHVTRNQQIYVEAFRGQAPVVDLGCGRGEFLELMAQAGAPARGIEGSAELVAICRSKGLQADCADAFAFLDSSEPDSLGGILCCQMLEHLAPADVIRFIRLAHRALRPGGIIALETPNPESLAIFATHFYLDPSHTRPIPPALMAFHLEEAGFGALRIERLHPAVESMPALAELSDGFRQAFFGPLDYAAFGTKL